jgi:adenylate cyclase
MTGSESPADERWRQMLTNPSPFRTLRRIHRRIPSAPRCKSCAAPFAGPGGLIMPLLGHARWPKNPKYCTGCFRMLRENHGGAEIECSLLFADVRGSTAMAERLSPKEFNKADGPLLRHRYLRAGRAGRLRRQVRG